MNADIYVYNYNAKLGIFSRDVIMQKYVESCYELALSRIYNNDKVRIMLRIYLKIILIPYILYITNMWEHMKFKLIQTAKKKIHFGQSLQEYDRD